MASGPLSSSIGIILERDPLEGGVERLLMGFVSDFSSVETTPISAAEVLVDRLAGLLGTTADSCIATA